MSNEEDYSDMPPLVYDNEESTEQVVKPSLSINTDTNNDSNEGSDEAGSDNEEKNQENDEDESDDLSHDDDMFVLTDDRQPVRCSDDYQALCRYRDFLVKKETRRFHDIGAIYVSHDKDATVISYMDRNLIWNTERILKTFTIHRINKI